MTRLSLRWSGLERMRTCMSSEGLVHVDWSIKRRFNPSWQRLENSGHDGHLILAWRGIFASSRASVAVNALRYVCRFHLSHRDPNGCIDLGDK